MTLPQHVDIAIIGAGAAGIGAARTVQAAGRSTLLIEARERLGGRSWTVTLEGGIPFDVGCEWLHSADRNSLVPIAHQLGFVVDTSRPRWREQTFNVGFPADERAAFRAAIEAFYARAEIASGADEDAPASRWLEPGNRWNPLIDAISTYINGCELHAVSVHDMDAYEETDFNWRIKHGLGALIAAYGAPCPAALGTVASVIDHAGPRITIETSRGTLTAERVIVTIPTDLLAAEAVRFSPALPDKVAAAAGLPLGLADKVMLAVTSHLDDLPPDGHLYGATDRAGVGSFHLRPLGLPCISGFFGGSHARQLADAGEGALAAQAIDEVVALLGSDWRRRLRPLTASRWSHDPFARGSYSHALPGHAGDRAILAAPVNDRLFFAGEATSPNFFTTAHGARDSGERAAREALASFSRR